MTFTNKATRCALVKYTFVIRQVLKKKDIVFFHDFKERTEQEFLNERQHAKNVLNLDGHDVNWKMVEFTLNANANTSIIPMQDVLGLDSSARMNIPGTVGGNWEWRMAPGMLTQEIKQHLRQLTENSNRT